MDPFIDEEETSRKADEARRIIQLDEDQVERMGHQTFLRSLHWEDEAVYNPLRSADHFDYFPVEEGFSSDMFFEVFSCKQSKSSTNSMTQISLLNDKVRMTASLTRSCLTERTGTL